MHFLSVTSSSSTEYYSESELDFVVSVDRFFNADCQYADIVLPATTYFETTSFCGYPSLGPPLALQYRRKIIEPVGEAMNDYLIYANLAERLGYGDLYPTSGPGRLMAMILMMIGVSIFADCSHQAEKQTGVLFEKHIQ